VERDFIMGAEQAKEYGIIDGIIEKHIPPEETGGQATKS